MKREKANAELNDTITGRSNNSLNRSGISLSFIRQIEGLIQYFRAPVNSGVRRLRVLRS
jgi:hypothetical protein